MSLPNFNSELCQRTRRHLDEYLGGKLPPETARELQEHLSTCTECGRELEARTRLREALRRAVANQTPPEELRRSIERRLRESPPGFWAGSPQLAWAAALVGLCILVVGSVAIQWRIGLLRGRRLVAAVLALGVSDHVQCALRGHNYPDVASPPDQLRQKLGPKYAGLLEVVQQKLPGIRGPRGPHLLPSRQPAEVRAYHHARPGHHSLRDFDAERGSAASERNSAAGGGCGRNQFIRGSFGRHERGGI